MADDKPRQETDDRGRAYDELSMNVVPSSVTEEKSEAPRRSAWLALVVFAILGGVALVVLGIRLLGNLAPGQDAERRLRDRLTELEAWQSGVILDARYLSGDTLRINYSPRLSAANDQDRETIREATRSVMDVFMSERAGGDLYIEGYQDGEQIARAEYRAKSTLVGPSGEPIPDVVVRVEGDAEGGMAGALGRGKPAAGR